VPGGKIHPVIPRAVTAALLLTLLSSCGGNGARPGAASRSQRGQRATPRLVLRPAGRLPVPVQLPAVSASAGGRVLSLGGLSTADTSTDGIVLLTASGRARMVGHLPVPVHDAAAARIGARVYLIGGGDTVPSSDVLRVSEDGRVTAAGRLPVAASDVAAASIGSTAYVVGGYTGATPLRSILAFTPGKPVRQVASLPRPLRYAAVAAVGPAVLIAGGTSGTAAQRAVLRFDPRTGRVKQIARLPHPLTHAAAAGLGGRFYVLGGRGDAVDSATAAVWALDPASAGLRRAGRLPAPLSDLGAASEGDRIVLAGGRDRGGRVRDVILSAREAP
jgi:N-acetylneuraminic acid mutarotase